MGPLSPNGTFEVEPPGPSPLLLPSLCCCMAEQGRLRTGGRRLLRTRSFGRFSDVLPQQRTRRLSPLPDRTGNLFDHHDACLPRGIVPTSLRARVTEFLGWVGMAVVPEVVLNRALYGHSGTTVILHYDRGASNVAFQSGALPRNHQSSTISFHNGWTVTTVAAEGPVGVLHSADALDLLVTGMVLSLLLGLLLFVLGTGRERARRGHRPDR